MSGAFVRGIEARLTVSARRDDFQRAWDLAVNSIVSGYESGTPLELLATGTVYEPDDERRIGSWVLEPEAPAAPRDYADEIAARIISELDLPEGCTLYDTIKSGWTDAETIEDMIARAAREGYALGMGAAQ